LILAHLQPVNPAWHPIRSLGQTLGGHRWSTSIRRILGLVDFSRLARETVARPKEIGQKHGVFLSIETLEGLLIFPDLLAKLLPDPKKTGKNTAFSRQSKCLTHSATEKSTRL
jgi:hypothetical protein